MVRKYKTDPLVDGQLKECAEITSRMIPHLPLLALLKSLAVKQLCRHMSFTIKTEEETLY